MNEEYKRLIKIISKMNKQDWEILESLVDNVFEEKASKISLEDSDLETKVENHLKTLPKIIRQRFESD